MPADLIAQLNGSLVGRYAIEREIGVGGMATVFLAEDLKHKRKVALKVLKPELAAMLGGERFVQEIATTASLQHPHLLPLFDSGNAAGQLYYVMPYMEGETLRERMRRETMLPVDEALRITAAVASALHYAHRHGVVHRDLKPENILFSEGEPVVSDFGIALAVSSAGGMRMTQTGMSLGTPQYMSPEQATGDRQIDARTDVYSLAAVLYEMLTGDPPHTGHNAQAVVAKVITERPRGLRETRDAVPPHVEAAVLRALAKLPADRFASAAEFAAAIAARGGVVAAPASGGSVAAFVEHAPLSRAKVFAGVRRWGVPVGALAAAALVGSLIAASRGAPPPVQPLQFDIHWTEANKPSPLFPGNLALSPDGTRLVRTLAGRAGIYSRPMDGLSWKLIPGTDSARATAPTFSPDGKFILYCQRPPGAVGRENFFLLRMPVDGGAAVQIADSVDSDGFTWGDRDRVAFSRKGALWTVSALGDTPRLLAKPDSARHHVTFRTASFLPGGDAMLVSIIHGRRGYSNATANEIDSAYLGAVSVDNGKVTDFGIRGVGAKYSLGHILYTDASGTLIALPFDPKRLRVTGPPTKLAEGALVNVIANDMQVSENGWVLYVPKTTVAAPSVQRFGVDRLTRPSTVHQLNVQEQGYLTMSVSPDGERVALCVATQDGSSDVWILQLATGHLDPLTRDGKNCYPVWTRDGKRVAYRVGSTVIFQPGTWLSVPWDLSGPPEPVPGTDGALEYEPGLPGGYFATVRADSTPATGSPPAIDRGDIWIASVDTPAVRRPFAATAAGEWAPRLSPDGKWLAYMLFDPTVRGPSGVKVYVRPVPGPGSAIQVSAGPGFDPRWGRDGTTLFYEDGTQDAGRAVAHLAFGRTNPVLRTERAFSVGASATTQGWNSYGVLPDGDIVELSPARTQATTPRAAPAPPPNPIAILGWLNLVKGSAASRAQAP